MTGGYYQFGLDDWGREKNSIIQLGGHYFFDNFTLGAMFLGSDKDQDGSGKNGGVISFKYRTAKSWKPGTYEIYGNYYSQPSATYRQHTMNGPGDSMGGFRGWMAGLSYVIFPEVTMNVEYYDLKDILTGEKGRTLWSSLTYNFN